MAEIFTISGTGDPSDLGYFGDAAPVPLKTQECAEQVKVPFIAGGVAMLGSVPVGLFGVYKLAKKSGAVGITALAGAAVLFWGGRALFAGAAKRFENCRRA